MQMADLATAVVKENWDKEHPGCVKVEYILFIRSLFREWVFTVVQAAENYRIFHISHNKSHKDLTAPEPVSESRRSFREEA